MSLIPSSRSVYIGGWSSGGNIALLLAAERVRRGMPVAGVILLDSHNGRGFQPKRHRTDYDDPARARSYVQMNHIEALLPLFEEPTMGDEVPILLIRAGADPLGRIPKSFPSQPADGIPRNFWTKENLRNLEVAVVQEANHKTLMDDAQFRPIVARFMREWCEKMDIMWESRMAASNRLHVT